jgi:hypothetical protein
MVKGRDMNKIKKIVLVLIKNPEGLWIRQISKETGLALSTVHYYINQVIDDLVDNIGTKDKKGHYFGLRIIRLKPKIKENIENEGLEKIYKFLKMYKKSISRPREQRELHVNLA